MFKKLLITSAAVAALAFPASAGAVLNDKGEESCPGQTFDQSFLQFNDKSFYTLVPNGSFEDGLTGWDVTGDPVVIPHVNEFLKEGSANALWMPAGSSVTSPSICVSRGYPYARAFLQRLSGGNGAALKVEVLYPPRTGSAPASAAKPPADNPHAGGNGNGNPNAGGNGNGGGNPNAGGNGGGPAGDRPIVKPAGMLQGRTWWRPSRRFSIGQGRIGRGTVRVRFRFTVKGDASYLLDDVLVDPRCRR